MIDDFERETLARYEGDTNAFAIAPTAYEGEHGLARQNVGGRKNNLIYDPSVTVERGQTLRWQAKPRNTGGHYGDTALIVRFDDDNWFTAGFEGGGGESSLDKPGFDFKLHYNLDGSREKVGQTGTPTDLTSWYQVEFSWTTDDAVLIEAWNTDRELLGKATFDLPQFEHRSAGSYGVFNNDPYIKSYIDLVERVEQ